MAAAARRVSWYGSLAVLPSAARHLPSSPIRQLNGMSETTFPTLRSLAQVARDRIRVGHRASVFQRAMRRLMRDPVAGASDSGSILSDLFYGWNNQSWSGEPELLRACIQQTIDTEASILECGSGLTTIVLGAIAQRMGKKMWSLEHMPEWAERVRLQLRRFDIDSVGVCEAPLTSYGTFDWYAPPPEVMSMRFGLVVCDGPPSQTRGGRYGLVPVMRPNLVDGCVILLDDAERESERAIVQRWAEEQPFLFTCDGVDKPYFRLVLENRPLVIDRPLASTE